MVQAIRRRRVQGGDDDSGRIFGQEQQRRSRLHNAPETSLKTCLQFLVMSSIIPALLFLRMARNDDDSFLKYKLTLPESLPENFAFLPGLLRNYANELHQHTSALDHEWLDSDIAELHHCRPILTTKDVGFWWNFTAWAQPLVNDTLKQLHRPEINPKDMNILEQEVVLELLELYGTQHGYCNFQRYRPTIAVESSTREGLLATANLQPPSHHARCAFVIAIRRKDAEHIKRLVKAIYMPHHFIIFHLAHLPQFNDQDPFVAEILEIAQDYENVVVVQEGSSHPSKEDEKSNFQLKIMRWLSLDLRLDYDYHITLDGASFPLLSAGELSTHLFASSQSVWLGSLTEQGDLVQQSQKMRLITKRLTTTSIPEMVELGTVFPAASSLPDFLDHPETLLSHKTTSGSFAVFSQRLVQQMLNSPMALQLFAMSKYSCCTTNLDSYNWMASLQLLSSNSAQAQPSAITNQAKKNTAMFQLWGGTKDKDDGNCNSAVHYRGVEASAILTMDPSRCYRIEHPQVVRAVYNDTTETEDWTIPKERRAFHGGKELFHHIHHAKRVGFLFARQFDSTDPESEAVLQAIEKDWETPSRT